MRSAAQADAEQTADPTAKTVIATLAPVQSAMGYSDPEAWLQIVAQTWARYHDGTIVGKAMRQRYKLRYSPEHTSIVIHVSVATYFNFRTDFLNAAGLYAAYKGLKIPQKL